MIRRLIAASAVLSLLLCITSVAMWVRSYVALDAIVRCEAGSQIRIVYAERGWIYFFRGHGAYPELLPVDEQWATGHWVYERDLGADWRDLSNHPIFNLLGVRYSVSRMGGYTSNFNFSCGGVSLPVLALILLSFPVLRGVAALRHRRRNTAGLCASCGYDLRASTDRCPECGTPIPPKS